MAKSKKKTFRELRKSKKLSIDQVAKELKISYSSLVCKELGYRKFNMDEIAYLCDLYDVDYRNVRKVVLGKVN